MLPGMGPTHDDALPRLGHGEKGGQRVACRAAGHHGAAPSAPSITAMGSLLSARCGICPGCALKLLPIARKGEHAGLPEATFYRAKSVYMETRQPVSVQMVGETGSANSFDVRIVPWPSECTREG